MNIVRQRAERITVLI